MLFSCSDDGTSLPTKPISKDAMERFLRKWDTSLLRAKGYLNFAGKSQILLMQYVAKRMNCEPSTYSGDPYFVFIGIELDIDRLSKEWNQRYGSISIEYVG
ncbi:GTP-binding protein [Paenibacillus sp. V4I5]|uniref:GTP-binding protein n=1 Tax=Paenibacillus sp. V4I5 TaxID=3042306 RepID=UPI0035942E29